MFVEDGIDTRSLGCAREDRVGGFRGRPGRCLVIWLAKRVFRDDYARDTFACVGYLFGVGKTVNAPEKGVIGRRLRRLLLFAVLASGVAELIKYLQSQGLLK